ncbi:MAG: hypothetical protein UR73_C0032G0010 [candidate division WS6 bacterium GW2011_GWF1_35_23]|uniref:Uncharacterized protein n=1 Tax=candidate division WS6 bacterium GW2011_GWF1_35_23 TaxID=1619097 RepID=A0A0G0F7M0_9BACT|nr:MAG: hypothetical protein UR73_C0032G0010 [candidate division WS6 bacterium GW2011_GWF1_35_23]
MLDIKDRTFEVDNQEYCVIKYLSGALIAEDIIRGQKFLVFQGLEEDNTFIFLTEGKDSLCPDNIKEIFPEMYQKVDYGNSRVYLVGRDGVKHLLVYSENAIAEPGSTNRYNIETINIVEDDDELIFYHFGHTVISLGITKSFKIKGKKII